MMLRITRRRLLALGMALLFLAHPAATAEIRVISSGGFAAASRALASAFEHVTDHILVTE